MREETKRWGLKREGREFIAHQPTKEDAVLLFMHGLTDAFRIVAPPSPEDVAAGVYELGPSDGKVLVDRAPARETR